MAQKRCFLIKILVGFFPGFHSVTQFACSQDILFFPPTLGSPSLTDSPQTLVTLH